jgi:hypothetical protein
MGATVTDPALIAQLEAAPADPPDPAALSPNVVKDPKLIAQLEGETAPAAHDWGEDLTHQGKQLLKGAANALFALPGVAMDAGVAGRNVVGDAYNRAVGNPATPDYELPSTTWHNGMNEIFGAPRNNIEKVSDVALPMLMSAGAGAESAPSLLRNTLAATPSTGTTLGGTAGPLATAAETNFLSPTEQKRQALIETLKKSQDLGLVVPRATTNPTALNQLVETAGSKVGTAQAAAVHNQAVANKAASEYVGLNPDLPLSVDSLKALRNELGQGYQAVRKVGDVATDSDFRKVLNGLQDKYASMHADFPGSTHSPIEKELGALDVQRFGSNTAMDKIIALRDKASAAYRSGESDLGADYKKLATALEDQIDRHISLTPGVSPTTVSNFRNARAAIAKTHTIEDALGPNGDVSIAKLASMKKGGDYMTDEAATLADFGNTFKKAAQSPASIGSPGVNHLEGGLTLLSTLGGSLLGGHAGHGAEGAGAGAALGMAIPLARRMAIARALSESGQKSAVPALSDGFFSTASPKSAAALAQGLAQINGP